MSQYTIKAKNGYYVKFSNVDSRPNKLARGLTQHNERAQKFTNKHNLWKNNFDASKLSVKGTLDTLRELQYSIYAKWVMVEHSIDKGYFKKVLVLTEAGKNKLKYKKK